MPYTVAHAVVALPFRRARWWSASGVAAGAMAPDLPLWFRMGEPATSAQYRVTHALWATPTVDLLLGVLLLLWWAALLKPALVAAAPVALRRRLPRRVPPALPPLRAGVLASIALGALTHVVWDEFTHVGRFGSMLLPVLDERFGWFSLASWLQYGCSVLGLAALLLAGALALRRRAAAEVQPELSSPARRAALAALGAGAVLGPAATLVLGGARAPATVVLDAVTAAVLVVLLGLSVLGTALVTGVRADRVDA